MEICFIDEGLIVKRDIRSDKEKRLFISKDSKNLLAKTNINKFHPNYKLDNRIILFDDLEYILPNLFHKIILDFDPSHDELEELKLYASEIYYWPTFITKKIVDLDIFDE